MKTNILLKRKYLLAEDTSRSVEPRMAMFYAAQLLNRFGVIVDKPDQVTPVHVGLISELYGIDIPKSFYVNPQDTKYFTCDELLLEQIIGYMFNHGADSSESSRIELFKKALPDYQEGKEVVFRDYTIVNKAKATEILIEIAANLADYTRKWSESEGNEFEWLYKNNFMFDDVKLKGKDNAIEMFNKYPSATFSRSLDQKDIVKLSVEMQGEQSELSFTLDQKSRLFLAASNCKKVPLTKKQAKYWNTIVRHVGVKTIKETNINSPHKKVVALIKQGNILEAAQVYAKHGSLLSRNLVWLLSRASLDEAVAIIDMVKVTNPLVTMQFLQSLLDTSNGARVFSFYRDGKVVRHRETEYEAKWRKSVLSKGMNDTLREELLTKVDEFYKNLPNIGKVYIDEAFKKIAVPFNTSAMGDGIDVVATGTRQPITEDYIRMFCYWNNISDVDSSTMFIDAKGGSQKLSWQTYHGKPFGVSALCSGDDTSSHGAEYTDINLAELEALGFKYAVYALNGYGGSFDQGETYCGYQNKKDLNTKAWDAKNMAIKIKVPSAHSRQYTGFIIDIVNRELIVVNEMTQSNSRLITDEIAEYYAKYMNSDYVKQFNIYKIASLRGEVVTDMIDADVIFSDENIVIADSQKQIRTTDIEKLVALML